MLSLVLMLDYFLSALIFALNIFVQNFHLGKLVNVFTDEGVYLYSAKLISDGYVPYKDFFLGQAPYLLLPISLLFKLTNANMILFHFLYTVWVFSAVFPIYFIICKLTKSRLAAIFGLLLFSTYQELTQWGMHQFDLRQCSLPFLAFALYFIYVKNKPKLSGILMAFFALSLASNLIQSVLFIGLVLFSRLIFNRENPLVIIKKFRIFLLIFTLVVFFGYLILFFIPNGYDNFIGYQLNRPFLAYGVRFLWLKENILTNWPIFFFGLLGSFLMFNKTWGFFGLFNLLGLPLVVFLGSNYYPHYLTILSVGLAIASGRAIEVFSHYKFGFLVFFIVVVGIYKTSYSNLKYQLIEKETPNFFQTVGVLKNLPGPIFAFEPIYGLWAGKNLTFHYNVADMRYFRVMGKNLTDGEYEGIIAKSNSIVIEPFAQSMLSQVVLANIDLNFYQIYGDPDQKIYARKNLLKSATDF